MCKIPIQLLTQKYFQYTIINKDFFKEFKINYIRFFYLLLPVWVKQTESKMCFLGKNGRKNGSSTSSNHERHKSRKKSNVKYKELDLQVFSDGSGACQ